MTIEISIGTADAILKLDERYYFDLFKNIRSGTDEEYQIRDAIAELATEIKEGDTRK